MLLKNNFFKITNQISESNNINAIIEINAEHKIFEGHFKNQPVVPGVCMMQIIKEICEEHFNKKLFVSEGSDIKFLNVIDPTKENVFDVNIKFTNEENCLKITGNIFKNDIVYFKLKCVLNDL